MGAAELKSLVFAFERGLLRQQEHGGAADLLCLRLRVTHVHFFQLYEKKEIFEQIFIQSSITKAGCELRSGSSLSTPTPLPRLSHAAVTLKLQSGNWEL